MAMFYNAITKLQIEEMVQAFLLLVIGFVIAKVLSASLNKLLSRRLTPQQSMLLRRILFYSIFLLFLASAIQQLGFHIGALLGATGILTVAVGIASQTSMSNVISGIFIIGEKPFQIGDTIKVNEVQGDVIAIDFLSVKIRTSENTMVRVPNEILIKSAITNLSYFPTRRTDLSFSVCYQADIEKVKKILFNLAEKNPVCLADPKPTFLISGLNQSSISIQFFAWSTNVNQNELKNTLQSAITSAFHENDITLSGSPYELSISNSTQPLPIKIIDKNPID